MVAHADLGYRHWPSIGIKRFLRVWAREDVERLREQCAKCQCVRIEFFFFRKKCVRIEWRDLMRLFDGGPLGDVFAAPAAGRGPE